MILVDTSVWISHFRRTDSRLVELLEAGDVLTHPMVIGELACGNLPKRDEVLSLLQQLPSAPAATDDEALTLIEHHRLMGRGVGYVDVHLLAAALLGDGVRLWTEDARLGAVARRLFVSS